MTLEVADTRVEREFGHNSPTVSCRFDLTGRFLFSGHQDGGLLRWDLRDGAVRRMLPAEGWVRAIGFAGNRFLAADYHGFLFSGSVSEPESPVLKVTAHQGWVRALAVSADGTKVATCGNDCLVRLWAVDGLRPLTTFAGHGVHVYNVIFHPKYNRLISVDLHGGTLDRDITTGKVVREFDGKSLHKYDGGFHAHIGGARGIAFRKDGEMFALCGITNVTNAFAGVGKPVVLVFDWKSGKLTTSLVEAQQGTAWGVDFLADGSLIFGGGGGQGRVWFRQPNADKTHHQVAHRVNIKDLATHPDGTRFATAGFDGVVRVFTMTERSWFHRNKR